jgi:Zn finger protein HypA/HybF involved in hydrogenase expression
MYIEQAIKIIMEDKGYFWCIHCEEWFKKYDDIQETMCKKCLEA